MTARDARRWGSDAPKEPPDSRTPGQRDRDRVLYTRQFRRLAEVTQVVGTHEMELFHNRLTHTLEVAQIARRLAERWVLGGATVAIDPDVVEAGALAHDLGHPPFGHIAEKKLDELMLSARHPDGFEGNAQSFRILTKLARRSEAHAGLDLTRASLQATTKYPWARGTTGKRNRKFGMYQSEAADYDWSRHGLPHELQDRKTAEAEIMDWADDVAYALHEMDDFFQAGMIPLERLAIDEEEQQHFLDRTFKRWREETQTDVSGQSDYERVAQDLFAEFPLQTYASASTRVIMSQLVGVKINSFIAGLSVQGSGEVVEDPDMRREIDLLKSLTWTYVIEAPALAAQQEGHRRVIETLFAYFLASAEKRPHVLPTWAREYLGNDAMTGQHESLENAHQRIACDVVASLSERQAIALYARLTGIDTGSVIAAIVN